jgi:hypothetical protein
LKNARLSLASDPSISFFCNNPDLQHRRSFICARIISGSSSCLNGLRLVQEIANFALKVIKSDRLYYVTHAASFHAGFKVCATEQSRHRQNRNFLVSGFARNIRVASSPSR